MIKQYLVYFTRVLKINLIVSTIATSISSLLYMQAITAGGLIIVFIISFLTGGYFSGTLYFELFRKNEYYFFFNLGLSKPKLILISFLFHLIISLPLILVAHYVRNS